MRLAGDAIDERDERGERVSGHTLLLLLNADHEPIAFALPLLPAGRHWEEVMDSANGKQKPLILNGGEHYNVKARSSAVLVLQPEKRRRVDDVRRRPARAAADADPAMVASTARDSHAPVVPAS